MLTFPTECTKYDNQAMFHYFSIQVPFTGVKVFHFWSRKHSFLTCLPLLDMFAGMICPMILPDLYAITLLVHRWPPMAHVAQVAGIGSS